MSIAESPTLRASQLSRAEAVARTIETEISSGTYSPGDSLGTKDALKQRFGVAVATINEAIKLLGARGMVEARPGPGGGVFVSEPSARRRSGPLVMGFEWTEATMADYHEVRDALEPFILRHAAEHHSERDIADLQEIVDRMEQGLHEPAQYLRQNTAFHRRVAAISPNPAMRSLYVTVLDFFEHAVDPEQLPPTLHVHNLEVHQQLLAGIVSRDLRQLRAAMRAHDRHRREYGLALEDASTPARAPSTTGRRR